MEEYFQEEMQAELNDMNFKFFEMLYFSLLYDFLQLSPKHDTYNYESINMLLLQEIDLLSHFI